MTREDLNEFSKEKAEELAKAEMESHLKAVKKAREAQE